MSFTAITRLFPRPLRHIDELGSDAKVTGRPWIENQGRIQIGHAFQLGSTPALSHLVVGRGGVLTIGDRVSIAYGAAVAVHASIEIGDDTRLAPYSVLMDSDFHNVGDRDAAAEVTPIVIGQGVKVGARVTILRGTTIGDGARILAGSVVRGSIPPGAVFGGVPARSVGGPRRASVEGSENLPALVQRVLGLNRLPESADGPQTLAGWDSLGTLKLLLAIEEAYSVTIAEEDMNAARSLANLTELLARALSDG